MNTHEIFRLRGLKSTRTSGYTHRRLAAGHPRHDHDDFSRLSAALRRAGTWGVDEKLATGGQRRRNRSAERARRVLSEPRNQAAPDKEACASSKNGMQRSGPDGSPRSRTFCGSRCAPRPKVCRGAEKATGGHAPVENVPALQLLCLCLRLVQRLSEKNGIVSRL